MYYATINEALEEIVAGMRWSERGAQALVSLRALWLSGGWHNIDQILKDAS